MKDSFRPKTVQGVTPVHALRNREKGTGDGENARDVVCMSSEKRWLLVASLETIKNNPKLLDEYCRG
jgi:hypothetical protein